MAVLILASNYSFAQVITGSKDVCPLRVDWQGLDNPYTYTISSPPFKDLDYVYWTVEYLGSDGLIDGYVDGVNQITTYNSGTNLSIEVHWGTQYAGQDAKITATAYQKNGSLSQYYQLNGISIRGIDNGSISGNKSPTKCCTTEITYTVGSVGPWADTFEWLNIPSGWQLNSATNLHTLKVEPYANTGGTLTCRVRMSCSDPSYYKDVPVTITRPDASINLGAVDLNVNPQKNKLTGICARRQYTYEVPEVCGADSYTWNFPTSWQQNTGQIGGPPPLPHQFYISGQGTRTVVIETANTPQDGQITVTAHFGIPLLCDYVTSASIPVTVLPNPPVTPEFLNISYEFFHCGEWKFCNEGTLEVSKPSADEIESYTWTITAPWYFQTAQGPKQTLTINVDFWQDGISPQIVRSGNGTAQLSVFATNCKGNSSTATITVVPEDPGWCPGMPFWSPYPLGCECCEPGTGDPGPRKQSDVAIVFKVYPNPSSSTFVVAIPSNEIEGTLSLIDVSGSLISTMPVIGSQMEINRKDLPIPNGVYVVRLVTANKVYTERVIISSNEE